ncbi:hypothetical protein [Flagellimonas maritima]|uniref:hypothetical protein n=1 Tax=Flagellimonas maritima TaxID=1383885 RepID=UPI0013DFDC97|nr:hypothetical protein [Allomuricauda aurantiaca]
MDEIRGKKELPKAEGNLIKEYPRNMLCIPRSEHILALIATADIKVFKNLE